MLKKIHVYKKFSKTGKLQLWVVAKNLPRDGDPKIIHPTGKAIWNEREWRYFHLPPSSGKWWKKMFVWVLAHVFPKRPAHQTGIWLCYHGLLGVMCAPFRMFRLYLIMFIFWRKRAPILIHASLNTKFHDISMTFPWHYKLIPEFTQSFFLQRTWTATKIHSTDEFVATHDKA